MSYATKDQLVQIMGDAATKTKAGLGERVSENLLRDTVGWTGKNLHKIDASSTTINGITFTVNNDGSITLNGKSTDAINFYTTKNLDLDTNTKYRCSKNTFSETVHIAIHTLKNGQLVDRVVDLHQEENSQDFTLSGFDNYDSVGVDLWINDNVTLNNLSVYFMITRADITDNTYEPYHKPVEDLLIDYEITSTDPGEGSALQTGKLLFVTEEVS